MEVIIKEEECYKGFEDESVAEALHGGLKIGRESNSRVPPILAARTVLR